MPSEATLTKTQFVLPKTFEGGGSQFIPAYVSFDAANEEMIPSIDITRTVWEDMGSPESVTVTLEPGDTLNA